jgi:superfamily II DNA or RNA helicase
VASSKSEGGSLLEIKKAAEDTPSAAINSDCNTTVLQKPIPIKIRENILVPSNTPKAILSKIIAENTFQNPRFASNEKNGFSNYKTPQFIKTFSERTEGIIVPVGFGRRLLHIFEEQATAVELVDERASISCEFPILHDVQLRDYQQRAVDQAMNASQGCIISPTGSGKSFIGLEIICRRRQKALILVHRGDLADQWDRIIKERLGLTAGFIGCGHWWIGNEITIAMVQTAAKQAKKLSDEFGLVLVDEAHHIPAQNTFSLLGRLSARFRYGLTATPTRADGLENLLYMAIGPAVETICRDEVEGRGATVPATVKLINTRFDPGLVSTWQEYVSALTTSPERNKLIVLLAKEQSSPTLILVDRIEHAEIISGMLSHDSVEHVLVHGQLPHPGRAEAMQRMRTAAITIGTTSLLGEGLDVAAWSCLILAAPISSETKLLQAVGRVVRSAPGKTASTVFDLKDNHAFSGASFNSRFEIYKKHKIWVDFTEKREQTA